MTAKKWLIAFVCILLCLALLVPVLNYFIDPFGVFGPAGMNWDSYDMTMNPRTAKIAYLEEHHREYDSYIIGCSSTSSYPVETLNAYYGASFYNLITYGADMHDTEQLAAYVLEHYEVKNLLVNIYIENGRSYDVMSAPLTDALPPQVSGEAALPYYLRYLLADPAYAVEKVKCSLKDTWLQQSFDVFDPETGAYDKSRRDAEPINSEEQYYESYPEFVNYPENSFSLPQIQACAHSLERIAALCEEKGVKLTVFMSPVYWKYLDYFPREQLREFYTAIARVCDFWDFSYSSVSFEPRYFYDRTHLRNAVGDMAIARMCGDSSVYVPRDFGTLVTEETVESYMDGFFEAKALPKEDYSARVPVLMYHHLAQDTRNNEAIITPAQFEAQIKALTEAGFTAVSLEELYAYVAYGASLPEKPLLITFDDGYYSNYEYAFPILQKYQQKATIFAVGVTFGSSTYKDTGEEIIPHFGAAEAEEMVASGLISIQSHTYDMHQVEQYDGAHAREGILRKPGEGEGEYLAALEADLEESRRLISSVTGTDCDALAFPYGKTSQLSNTLVSELGFRFSFCTQPGINEVLRGLPQSLYGMQRFTVTESISPGELVALCAGETK